LQIGALDGRDPATSLVSIAVEPESVFEAVLNKESVYEMPIDEKQATQGARIPMSEQVIERI
jgi:hypothetical protein